MKDVQQPVLTERVKIRIPGLKKERRFLQISDAHITAAYPGDPACETEMAKMHAVKWNTDGIEPMEAFCRFLTFAAGYQPDAVLFSGDLIDYYTKSNVRRLKELLADAPFEYLYAWGNHEDGSYGLPMPDNAVMEADLSPLMHGQPLLHVRDYHGFRIVTVKNSSFDVTDFQIERMREIMTDQRPILLHMHAPIHTDAFAKTAWSMFDADSKTTDNAREFAAMIRREDSPVLAILAGHEHFAWSGEFAPGRMQYVSAPCFTRFIREIRVVAG